MWCTAKNTRWVDRDAGGKARRSLFGAKTEEFGSLITERADENFR